ncbi:MAG TPA: glycosyl hydrolase-related protein, partial [Candidatus Nitrosocosmicus sp.]|nr:glycosyl hydrolase-related protein [Candidatus Nitrosocosmicus sp.]
LKEGNSENSTSASETTYQSEFDQLSCFSFLELTPKNILLSNLKLSKNSKSTIMVRIYETEGRKKTLAKLRFGRSIKSASFTDLLGNEIKKIKPLDKQQILIEMGAFQIATLNIEF